MDILTGLLLCIGIMWLVAIYAVLDEGVDQLAKKKPPGGRMVYLWSEVRWK